MTKYTADIGSYDRGKNVDLPNSKTLEEAISEATEILKKTTFNFPISEPYVVQIYRIKKGRSKIVWDYMNGSYYQN